MDPEGFVLGPRAKRAVSLIAAALTVIVVGSLAYLHQSAPLPARFVGVPPPPELGTRYAVSYEFADSRHGWAAVHGFGPTSSLTIFRTTDGAHSWRAVSSFDHQGFVQSFHFWDQGNGILETDHVYKTDDAGSHWTVISLPDNSRSYVFASPSVGWAVDAGRVFVTDDGGLTWRMRGSIPGWSLIYRRSDLRAMDFGSNGVGWAGTSYQKPRVYSTEDGGASWIARDLPFGALPIPAGKPAIVETSVRVLPGGAVFVQESGGYGDAESFVSSDNGLTWKSALLPWKGLEAARAYVSFLDGLNWWVSSHDVLYRTADAGRSWKLVKTVTPLVLEEMDFGPIHMLNARFGWMVASGPPGTALAVSSDGGTNWSVVNVPKPV